MQRTTKYFFIGMTIVIIYALLFFSVSFLINVGENQMATMYVQQVNGVPNFSNPGGESFWSSVPSYNVPLIDSVPYPGSPSGHTSAITVQMAWTATGGTPELLIRMQFPWYGSYTPNAPNLSVPMVNDTTHKVLMPIYNSSCIYPTSTCYGGVYPQDVGFMPLAQGTQYRYPAQAIVMLGMTPGANTDAWYAVSYKPKMVLGTSGALGTGGGGQAEMWIYSRSPTDNSSSAYPGITYPNGTAVNPTKFGLPNHASYAMDGYTNASSFYQIGGVPPSSMFPYINTPQFYTTNYSSIDDTTHMLNPFEVQAKGAYSNGNYVVEYIRPLMTSSQFGENKYQLQMNQSSSQNYHIAFAVSQESASQTYLIYYNSVSFWWNFNFQTTSGFNGYSNQYGSIANGAAIPLSGLMIVVLGLVFLGRRLDTTSYSVKSPLGF